MVSRVIPMSELDKTTPVPTEIKLHQLSRQLEIAFNNGTRFELPYEFLRVYSPSAEVRGHGPGQEVLQVGKKDIAIKGIEPVGSYAVTLTFSDGHDTGIYSWDYLYELGANYVALWGRYVNRMEAAGASREPLAGAPERPKAK
jgi:DUF971 family protein